MNIQYCSDYEDMSNKAARSIIDEMMKGSAPWLCAATGSSPKMLYKKLAEEYENYPKAFSGLGIVKLDEWVGIPEDEEGSCEHYIQKNIIYPLRVREERYIAFKSDPHKLEEECQRIQSELEKIRGMDICVLGIGKNGHLGLNEPADTLIPNCHVALLSEKSKGHDMLSETSTKPKLGLTLGMTDILSSKKIVLLVTGSGKQEVLERLLRKKVDTHLPASFLWLHPRTECFLDTSSLRV